MTIPYWQVGIKIGAESGQVNVHSNALPDAFWCTATKQGTPPPLTNSPLTV